MEPETQMGPLISQKQFDRVNGYIESGTSQGAEVVVGGKRVDGRNGYFMQPTVFADVTPEMTIAREEIFGPVLAAIDFADVDEAIARANDSVYGLAAGVWTKSIQRALDMPNRLEAGMVWVNSENVRHLPTPFGGMKSSGIGRDGGDHSFEFYIEQKNIAIGLDRHKPPKIGV